MNIKPFVKTYRNTGTSFEIMKKNAMPGIRCNLSENRPYESDITLNDVTFTGYIYYLNTIFFNFRSIFLILPA
jgi:hypothetical protein